MGIINVEFYECYPDFKSVDIIKKSYPMNIIRQKPLPKS